MAYRLQAFGRALRLSLTEQHQAQIRRHSVFNEFVKKVREEVESNPSLKQSVEELKQKTKSATDGLQKAASASAEATRAATQQVSSIVQESISQVSQGVKGTVEDLRKSSATGVPQGKADQASQEAAAKAAAQPDASAAPGSSAEASTHGTAGAQAANAAGQKDTQADGGGSRAQQGAAEGSESTSAGEGSSQAGAEPRSFIARLQGMAATVRKEVAAAILPEENFSSATRAHAEELRAPVTQTSSAVAVMPKTRWQKQWEDMQDKLGGHPLFKRLAALRDHKVFSKGREVAEDIRERWESSDLPFVNRIQDMTESMFVETEMAKTVREIRARDPNFDMVKFLRSLKEDVRPVITAYLAGDEAVLRQHCSPACVERLLGILHAERTVEDKYPDTNLLDVSEVELHDLQIFEDNPVVVVKFSCQQIRCFRDKFDNIVEGSADDVHRVLYVWALQQDQAGFVGTDGRLYAPQWQIGEMAVGVAQKLL